MSFRWQASSRFGRCAAIAHAVRAQLSACPARLSRQCCPINPEVSNAPSNKDGDHPIGIGAGNSFEEMRGGSGSRASSHEDACAEACRYGLSVLVFMISDKCLEFCSESGKTRLDRLPSLRGNLMFCLTLDDFTIGNEASVSRNTGDGRLTASRRRCGSRWDTRTSGGNQASPFPVRRPGAPVTASPVERSDDRRPYSTNYGEFARAKPVMTSFLRTLIRDSAEGIPSRVVAPRHVGAGQG